MENPIPKDIIKYKDILKGVGELIVDEAKLAIHAIFRMPHQLASHGDHLPTEELITDAVAPEKLNRWDDCGRDLE